MSMNVVIRFTD